MSRFLESVAIPLVIAMIVVGVYRPERSHALRIIHRALGGAALVAIFGNVATLPDLVWRPLAIVVFSCGWLLIWYAVAPRDDDDPPFGETDVRPLPRGGLVLPAPRHRLLTFVPRSLPAPQEDQTIALPLTADEHEGVTR